MVSHSHIHVMINVLTVTSIKFETIVLTNQLLERKFSTDTSTTTKTTADSSASVLCRGCKGQTQNSN